MSPKVAMKMTSSQIRIRLSKQEKSEFEKNAQTIGLTTSAAIKLFIAKVNRDKGFSDRLPRKDSDEISKLPLAVEKAMLIAKAEEVGLLEDTSERIGSIVELRQRWHV